MYLGHLVFLAGLALSTRSPLAAAIFVGSVPWFNARAAADEKQLEARFGHEYRTYGAGVPRWLPLLSQ
jgi:protein-S-isoprenylcysteine O-methyltransferase Ste14